VNDLTRLAPMKVPTAFRLLVFTDLDGTLLDHDTYDFSAALPALEALRAAHVPLILCSSKTFAELAHWWKVLDLNDPFITENGGGWFIPKHGLVPAAHQEPGAAGKVPAGASSSPPPLGQERYCFMLMGASYATLRTALGEIAKATGLPLVGFGDLSVAQVAARTGLTDAQSRLAKMRDADEPFFIDGDYGKDDIDRLQSETWRIGLRMTRGGRFFHLTGRSDKGSAARELLKLYRAAWQQPIRAMGLGDSLNDLPLLQAVDAPVLVRKKNGEIDERVLAHTKAQVTIKPGPAGWNEAVLEFLRMNTAGRSDT
jgi:mannosyl-3-phosphoglycerate phosphatase